MHIGRVAAIILTITVSSLTLAGAEDLTSPYPQDVRVNINVAEIATLTLAKQTIALEADGNGSATGNSAVDAQANFNYQIRTEYTPWPAWGHETTVTNGIDGLHDALHAASGSVTVTAALAEGTAEPSITGEAAMEVATASAGITYDGASVGIVAVTLTHAP